MVKPTGQQVDCINALKSLQLMKVEACAGAGKTSLLVMMAEAVPLPSLYLAFNKATATEADEKFPRHVTCKTTHSVAYAACGSKIQAKLTRPRGRYMNVAGTGSEIAKYYKILAVDLGGDVIFGAAFLGLLVKQTVARFEQSADRDINVKHLPSRDIHDKTRGKGKVDTSEVSRNVLLHAKTLWRDRINPHSKVLATHDTYLKMFQMSKPVLSDYGVLYVDEAADSTPCVMDIVMSQQDRMKIVLVGDAFQAIYGFRGACNAMEMLKCPAKPLTKSFRYGQVIADVATAVLEGKLVIEGNGKVSVASRQCVDVTKPHARLFRTNSLLLSEAIITIKSGVAVCIETDTKDFVKLLSSALALKGGDYKSVKHDKLLPFTNWGDLINESKNDPELGRVAKAVKEGDAHEWIAVLENHVNSTTPLVTFTTCHKAKGRQWSQVKVEEDFKSARNEKGEWVGLAEAEQNLLYVALTRAEDVLEYNATTADYVARYAMLKAA